MAPQEAVERIQAVDILAAGSVDTVDQSGDWDPCCVAFPESALRHLRMARRKHRASMTPAPQALSHIYAEPPMKPCPAYCSGATATGWYARCALANAALY